MSKSRTIKIKYFDNEIDRISKIDKGDWIDLRAAETVELQAGEFTLIPLGVGMILPEGYEAHVVPRSSTFKTYGVLQTNSMGVIDNSYCGEDDQWYFPAYATRATTIHKNDRICQFRIQKMQPEIEFEEVEHLEEEIRGGFGSTGVSSYVDDCNEGEAYFTEQEFEELKGKYILSGVGAGNADLENLEKESSAVSGALHHIEEVIELPRFTYGDWADPNAANEVTSNLSVVEEALVKMGESYSGQDLHNWQFFCSYIQQAVNEFQTVFASMDFKNASSDTVNIFEELDSELLELFDDLIYKGMTDTDEFIERYQEILQSYFDEKCLLRAKEHIDHMTVLVGRYIDIKNRVRKATECDTAPTLDMFREINQLVTSTIEECNKNLLSVEREGDLTPSDAPKLALALMRGIENKYDGGIPNKEYQAQIHALEQIVEIQELAEQGIGWRSADVTKNYFTFIKGKMMGLKAFDSTN